ncbi:MAG: Rieske (2Fe-2S) protein [Pirellulales bacterium]|nr:Rieske (2Fe-2S) protein [Pirellulales bacterium]
MSEYVTVAKVGEISEGRRTAFPVGDRDVAVFHVGGKYYALDDFCPHMGASLGTSGVYGDTVVCSRRMWAFNLSDGVCVDVPTLKGETIEVRAQGSEIQVRVPETGAS